MEGGKEGGREGGREKIQLRPLGETARCRYTSGDVSHNHYLLSCNSRRLTIRKMREEEEKEGDGEEKVEEETEEERYSESSSEPR